MRENQVTPTRTLRRRKQEPLGLADALLHLRRRASLMRTKNPTVWLRWNRADVEAVDVLLAAISKKIENAS